MQRPSGIAAARLSIGTLIFTFLAMSLVQPVAAQATPGSLYFTNTLLTTADQTAGGCGIAPTFAISPVAPAAEAPVKAYLARGLFAVTCTTTFQYTVETPFTLSGDAQVDTFVNCDIPSVIRPADGTALTASARFILLKGTETVST
ncbi:MAG TPA: hypothetical protein VJ874_00785, partial [Candidatus Thermoplasmatota archaeon]|nr:hypothetical protein [Candidatus Thermoplasmatota archaeon]